MLKQFLAEFFRRVLSAFGDFDELDPYAEEYADRQDIPSREELSKKTKKQIIQVARYEYDIELSASKRKAELLDDFYDALGIPDEEQ